MARVRTAGVGALSLVACAVLLAGCTTETSNEEQATEIRGSWISDPANLDPAKLVGVDDFRASRLMFDTLLRRDDNNVFVPGIAESWASDATSAEFVLKDGLTCADGTELTATVVADSLTRLADPEQASAFRTLIFGGDDVTVTADDEARTVEVSLGQPYSDLLPGLTNPAAGIVCPAGIADPEGLNAGEVEGAFSGPYVLAERTPGVEYGFELREDYDAWPEYTEALEGRVAQTLTFSVGSDQTTAASQLVTGDLDVAAIGIDDVDRIESTEGAEISTINLGAQFVIFNESASSPFADQELRTAVAKLIDREAFLEVYNPRALLTLSTADPSVQCVNTDESLLQTVDPEAGSALAGVKIRYVGTTGLGPNGAGNEYIAELLRAAGADVELSNIDNAAWASQVLAPDASTWDMTVFGTVDTMGTMTSGLSRVIGTPLEDGGRNIARSDNPEGSAAFAEARAAADDDAKCEAYGTAQESALERVDFVPLATNSVLVATAPGVSLRSPADREDYSTLRFVD